MRFSIAGSAGSTRYALLAGVAAAAMSVPGVALAQDDADDVAAEEDAEDLGNVIVVTATKREQTLQEIPVAVSVTTAATIEQAQIRDIADLQSVVPSLRVSTLQSAFATSFSVRGFGTDGNNLGLEPSVAVFVDGVYRSRTFAQISDLPNLQRVEVLRGPQSTLFGKNASAGVISIVSSEPSFEFAGNAELSYGNFDAIVAKGYATGPISDSVAVSFAAGLNKRDGFITNGFNGDDLNNRDRWFTRGQLLFDNGDNLKVRLIADYDELDESCCAVANLSPSIQTGLIQLLGGQINDFDDRFDTVFTDVDPFNKVTNWGISGQVDYDIGALTLTSISAYRKSELSADQDVDFTSGPLASGAVIGQADIKTLTQELRLTSDFDGMFNFLIGGYYFKEDLETGDQITFGPGFRPFANLLVLGASQGALDVNTLEFLFGATPGSFFANGTGFDSAFTQDNEAFSLFGQIDLELTDRLTVTLGANWTKDKKDVVSNGVSTEPFSSVNLDAPEFTAARQAVLIGAGVDAGTAAFLAANPTLILPDGSSANPFAGLRAFQFLPPILNIPNTLEDGRSRDDELTYTIRANYELTDSLNAYVSYATGFKATSWNLSRDSRPLPGEFAQFVSQGLATPNLRPGTRFALPEKSTVYEIGLKANWDLATANLTIFQQSIEDFQANTFIGQSFVLGNAGKQETFGVEFEGTVNPTDELTLSMAVTYLDAKYDSFVGSPVGDLSGRAVSGVHPISASFGATWNKELANYDRIIVRADYQYESDVQVIDGLTNFIGSDPAATDPFEAARREGAQYRREINNVNASITYAMEMGLEFTLWARNLLDDRYITTIFPGVAQGLAVSGYPNQPRTYGVTGRFRF
ncbi:TonB-dependent receptor [Altererythrobacter sp. GH1-8]|uniref:TonB-dependent receptor n=1 Tax=Altererythrobacter sp. GH1-8 TaxID=3349333 RepID=UPI00374D80E3